MEEYLNMISNFGFPIFVCLYFMFRFEKILKSNTEAIRALITLTERKK